MISPESIFKPVLGLWITISEFPKNFPNFNQNFKGVVTWAYYFLQEFLNIETETETEIFKKFLFPSNFTNF